MRRDLNQGLAVFCFEDLFPARAATQIARRLLRFDIWIYVTLVHDCVLLVCFLRVNKNLRIKIAACVLLLQVNSGWKIFGKLTGETFSEYFFNFLF
jgi:hypothetical protein